MCNFFKNNNNNIMRKCKIINSNLTNGTTLEYKVNKFLSENEKITIEHIFKEEESLTIIYSEKNK